MNSFLGKPKRTKVARWFKFAVVVFVVFELSLGTLTPVFAQEVVNATESALLDIAPENQVDQIPTTLDFPIKGEYRVTRRFGEKTPDTLDALAQIESEEGHEGIDLAVGEGTPIFAVDDGEVTYSGYGDYGITIIIRHSWGESVYGHLSEVKVITEQVVSKGQEIALSGSSGVTTGPHLHLGLKDSKGIFVDPERYLRFKVDQLSTSENSLEATASAKLQDQILSASDSATLNPAIFEDVSSDESYLYKYKFNLANGTSVHFVKKDDPRPGYAIADKDYNYKLRFFLEEETKDTSASLSASQGLTTNAVEQEATSSAISTNYPLRPRSEASQLPTTNLSIVPTVDGNRVEFGITVGGKPATLRYTIESDRVKEEIILESKPEELKVESGELRVNFEVQNEGLEVVNGESLMVNGLSQENSNSNEATSSAVIAASSVIPANAGIQNPADPHFREDDTQYVFKNQDGSMDSTGSPQAHWQIAKPTVVDASGKTGGIVGSLSTPVIANDSSLSLRDHEVAKQSTSLYTLTLTSDYLEYAVYPVTIDPTVVVSGGFIAVEAKVSPREATRPFPQGKSRSGWIVNERIVPHATENGKWVEFEYEVFEDSTERNNNRPFFIVNHKAQLREDHQRIVLGPNGGLMHVDAGEVLLEDVESFLATNNLAYIFDPADGRWYRRRGGQVLDLFMFPRAPWAGGGDEGLDPQWQRELFTVPIADQVADAQKRRLDRVEAKQESGDKRGTTLNLVVGASSDDAAATSDGIMNLTQSALQTFGDTSRWVGTRFTSVTIPQGSTIDAATYTPHMFSTSFDSPKWRFYGEADDDPATYTTTVNDLNNRNRTAANVEWTAADVGAGYVAVPTSFNAIIQEVVDRAGFAESALAIDRTYSGTPSSGNEAQSSYDRATDNAAKLDIDYTAASSNQNPSAPSSLGPASLVDGSFGSDNTPTPTFTLSDPDGADTVKFQIQIDDTSDFSSAVVDYTSALAAQGSTSFTVGQAAGSGSYTTGSAGQTLSDGSYYWRVKAIDDDAAESSYSTANSGAVAFVLDATAPASAPTGVGARAGANSATVFWSLVSGASTYRVYQKSPGTSTFFSVGEVNSPAVGMDISPLTCCREYAFYVTALDELYNESAQSVTVYASPYAPTPGSPQTSTTSNKSITGTTGLVQLPKETTSAQLRPGGELKPGSGEEFKGESGPKLSLPNFDPKFPKLGLPFGISWLLKVLAWIQINSMEFGYYLADNFKAGGIIAFEQYKILEQNLAMEINLISNKSKQEFNDFALSLNRRYAKVENSIPKASEFADGITAFVDFGERNLGLLIGNIEALEFETQRLANESVVDPASNFLANGRKSTVRLILRLSEGASNGANELVDTLADNVKPVFDFGSRVKNAGEVFHQIVFKKDPNRIGDVSIAYNSPTSVTVYWHTIHLSRSKVNFGFDTSYGEEAYSNDYVRDHYLTLENLDPGKTYYFEVMSQNGGYVFDAYYTFTTPKDRD